MTERLENEKWEHQSEMAELVEFVCHQTINAEQLERLEHLVCTDRKARRFYIRYLHLHANLGQFQLSASGEQDLSLLQNLLDHSSQSTPSVSKSQILEAHESSTENSSVGTSSTGNDPSSVNVLPNTELPTSVLGSTESLTTESLKTPWMEGFVSHLGSLSGLATSVALMFGFLMVAGFFFLVGSFFTQPSSTNILTSAPVPIAKVIRSSDVVWHSDTQLSGNDIQAGQTYELVKGVLELEFSSAARVTLIAPVHFRTDSKMQLALHYGQLKASVPPQAIGFKINTPAIQVVDLGTEFGVQVQPTGATEVHVFQGMVEAFYISRMNQKEDRLELTTNKAAKFDDGGNLVSQFSATTSLFSEFQSKTETKDPLLGKISLDPDLVTKLQQITTVDFLETPLEDVIQHLKDRYQLPIVIDTKSLFEAKIPLDLPITFQREEASLVTILEDLLRYYQLDVITQQTKLIVTTGQHKTQLKGQLLPNKNE